MDDLTLLECRTDCQESQLQCYLSKLNQWSHKNNMKLNPSKCFAMNVSFSRNQQLPGTYCIDNTVTLGFKCKNLRSNNPVKSQVGRTCVRNQKEV